MSDDPRKAVIDRKVAEIKKDLENWARTILILHPGEAVVADLKIEIVERPIFEMKFSANRQKIERSDEMLKEDDWEKILSIPLPKKLRKVVEVFHENSNEPIFPKGIMTILYEQKGFRSKRRHGYLPEQDVSILNANIRKCGYHYRLMKTFKPKGQGYHWDSAPLKFFIVR